MSNEIDEHIDNLFNTSEEQAKTNRYYAKEFKKVFKTVQVAHKVMVFLNKERNNTIQNEEAYNKAMQVIGKVSELMPMQE